MERGFFDLYCSYAKDFTDAPELIHRRVALSLLSICLNRKVWLVQGARNLYPNIWMVVVAASSFYRKSSSLWIGEDLLKRIPNQNLILAKEYSYEKFIEEMSFQSVGVFVANEFKTFMEVISKEYNSGMQSLLTDLYDCGEGYKRKTKGGGELEIKEPFINILSASTMDWLVASVKDADMAGGFLPRFLIVHAKDRGKSMPFQPPADQKKRQALIDMLTMACKLKGEVKFSAEAKKEYEIWYWRFENECLKRKSLLSPFYARLTDYAKKFSMIVNVERRIMEGSIGENWSSQDFLGVPGEIELSPGGLITPGDVSRACMLAESFAEEITAVVENDIVFDKREIAKRRVEKFIKNANSDGIGRSELLRETRILAKDLNPIIDTLEQ